MCTIELSIDCNELQSIVIFCQQKRGIDIPHIKCARNLYWVTNS